MILVIGETYDSLLGLRSLIGESDGIEPLVNDFPGFIGKIYGEDIVGITGGSSNYLSLITAEKAIAKYKPRAVFSFGESAAISPLLKLGDILIGNRIYIHGVNFMAMGLPYGSIPGFQPHYFSDIDLARDAERLGMSMTDVRVSRGDILSGEKKIIDHEEFVDILKRRYAGSGHIACYDVTSGGIAFACTVNKVPYLPLKAISYLPLESDEGLMKERRIALTANLDAAKVLLTLLKKGEER